jgi:hypothetical protein
MGSKLVHRCLEPTSYLNSGFDEEFSYVIFLSFSTFKFFRVFVDTGFRIKLYMRTYEFSIFVLY